MTPEERQSLLAKAVPRLVPPYVPHPPHPPQALFLLDQTIEAFYGGAAGGGKSDALLMAALQYVDVPRYSALILRRTYADLSLPGAIMERANTWLSGTPARAYQGRGWIFPSGAKLTFGYIQYPRDREQFRSAEFQMIGVDELTQFPKTTYEFMFSRLRRPAVICADCNVMVEKVLPGHRSPGMEEGTWGVEVADEDGWVHGAGQTNYPGRCAKPSPSRRALEEYPPSQMDGVTTLFDVPLRMRTASNPGGLGHAWVRDHFVEPERRSDGASFYPARLTDNPSLDQRSYTQSLNKLGIVERQRLLAGDWTVADAGTLFQRSWFEIVEPDEVPYGLEKMRYWDLASTAMDRLKDPGDPDFTAGALVGFHEGVWYIIDVVAVRESPAGVERIIAGTASQDGRLVPIRMEQEPGSSGVNTIDNYRRRILPGYDFDRHLPRGDKPDRARPWIAAAENGLVKLVRGSWNGAFLDEAETFPMGTHDDQIDAVSGAVECIATGRTARLIV